MTPAEVKREADNLEGAGGRTPLVEQMVAYWIEHRPKMAARLKRDGILYAQAMVLQSRQTEEIIRLVTAEGMSPDDAQRMTAEMLLMEPESEDLENDRDQSTPSLRSTGATRSILKRKTGRPPQSGPTTS